jgi:CubicO group peptidase (beta-lactamase class C family)
MLNGEKPARTEPVRVEATPGTKFAYSNGGYLVLYLLIEDVTGESFADS